MDSLPNQDIRRSQPEVRHTRKKLNWMDKFANEDIGELEERIKFAQVQVKDLKRLDYKTGASWHRVANKDADPLAKALL